MLHSVSIRRTLAVAAGLFLMSAGEGFAAPQAFSITGTITSVSDPGGLLPPSIVVGSAFNGGYSIDPLLATNPIVLANGTAYRSPVFQDVGTVNATVAGNAFQSGVSVVFVGNNKAQAGLGIVDLWTTGSANPPSPAVKISVFFYDTTTTKLGSEALFINQTNNGWTAGRLRIAQYGPSGLIQILAEGEIQFAPATSVLFLDRCAGGCVYTPGFDDSRTNRSSILNSSATLSAFPFGDPSFQAVVSCLRTTFAPFDIQVTVVDPGGSDHFEIAVAGTSQQVGLPSGIRNVSPVTCQNGGVVQNGPAFVFASTIGDAPLEICWNAAQAAGFLLGLDYELLTGDVMTLNGSSLPRSFLDQAALCGDSQPRDCLCGGTTQNSYQRLMTTLPEPGSGAGALLSVITLAVHARLSKRRVGY